MYFLLRKDDNAGHLCHGPSDAFHNPSRTKALSSVILVKVVCVGMRLVVGNQHEKL